MIYFTAHTFQCVCHCKRTMFRVLGVYNFGRSFEVTSVSKKSGQTTVVIKYYSLSRFFVTDSTIEYLFESMIFLLGNKQ